MTFKTLDEALEVLFSSFVARARLTQHAFDRDHRRPDILIRIASQIGVLPPASHTCLVSGSKGKGTTSRLIAWNLQSAGKKVGLLLTPEECEHRDRIRINNTPIPAQDFIRIFADLQPLLEKALEQAPSTYYFPPTGLFLLIGLIWFHECGVNAWVIEGGRGVRHDEIGGLRARVGVLTNILSEHLARLGPTIEEIAAEKAAMADCVETLVLPVNALKIIKKNAVAHPEYLSPLGKTNSSEHQNFPSWYGDLSTLAEAATSVFLPNIAWHHYPVPAYQFLCGHRHGENKRVTHGTICCDGVIHPDSLDPVFLRRLGLDAGAAIIGLSDDKSAQAVAEKLIDMGFKPCYGIELTSPVRHITTHWLKECKAISVLGKLDVVAGGTPVLAETLQKISQKHGSVYAVGTQVFMRSLRQAFGISTVLEPSQEI